MGRLFGAIGIGLLVMVLATVFGTAVFFPIGVLLGMGFIPGWIVISAIAFAWMGKKN